MQQATSCWFPGRIPPRTSLHPRIIYAGTPGCSDHESVSYHAGTSDLTYRFFPL
jgi:hypothetical protein